MIVVGTGRERGEFVFERHEPRATAQVVHPAGFVQRRERRRPLYLVVGGFEGAEDDSFGKSACQKHGARRCVFHPLPEQRPRPAEGRGDDALIGLAPNRRPLPHGFEKRQLVGDFDSRSDHMVNDQVAVGRDSERANRRGVVRLLRLLRRVHGLKEPTAGHLHPLGFLAVRARQQETPPKRRISHGRIAEVPALKHRAIGRARPLLELASYPVGFELNFQVGNFLRPEAVGPKQLAVFRARVGQLGPLALQTGLHDGVARLGFRPDDVDSLGLVFGRQYERFVPAFGILAGRKVAG